MSSPRLSTLISSQPTSKHAQPQLTQPVVNVIELNKEVFYTDTQLFTYLQRPRTKNRNVVSASPTAQPYRLVALAMENTPTMTTARVTIAPGNKSSLGTPAMTCSGW